MRDLGSSSRAMTRPWAMATKMITRHMMSGSRKAMNMPTVMRETTMRVNVAPTRCMSCNARRRVRPVCSRASLRISAPKQIQGKNAPHAPKITGAGATLHSRYKKVMAAADGTAGRISVAHTVMAQSVMAKNMGRCGLSEGSACTAVCTAKYAPAGMSRLSNHLRCVIRSMVSSFYR